MRSILRAAFLLCLLSGPVWAEMSAEKRNEMIAALQVANDAAMAGDADLLLDSIPDAIADLMAAQFGMKRAAMREQLMLDFAAARAAAGETPEAELRFEDAQYGSTPTGRDYAVFEIDSVVLISGIRCHVITPMLAFEENDRWVQLNVGYPASVELLRQAYPDFADITFGEITTQPL